MNNKYLLLIAFVFVAAAQIYVPASMILEREDILATGKTFKFKTTPIDPNDPMRGKYITLRFDENVFKVIGEQQFDRDEDVFVHLNEDLDGFVEIGKLSAEKPGKEIDFVKVKINFISTYNDNDTSHISINYPFDRFYMEESKAQEAEITYSESLSDSTTTTYAVVKIKDGEAVLEDVMIDGISITELVGSTGIE